MNLDWRRLKAVVIESDDWGLCAWSPDIQAHRVLTGMPAFRTTAGRRYGGSTLESAADMRAMMQLLSGVRGADGMPVVLQANTIMSGPDYAGLTPPLFPLEGPVPLMDYPDTRSRWARPGLGESLAEAQASGQWWPELHGLHHLPEHTWVAEGNWGYRSYETRAELSDAYVALLGRLRPRLHRPRVQC